MEQDRTGKKASFEVRTDLALEEKESFPGDGGEISGVALKEWEEEEPGIRLTEVRILSAQGARAMGKPQGVYMTLEADPMRWGDRAGRRQVGKELGVRLQEMIREVMKGEKRKELPSVLIAGLGNPSVTPDSLGPRVWRRLEVTRHLAAEYGADFLSRHRLPMVSGIAPGVMAQTGMETAEVLKGIIHETRPGLVIAVDALAARSVSRLGTTIQLTDTGIHPGSGVGNHRHSLTRESLGIPVLAVGVPTVVGAAAIVHHTLSALTGVLRKSAGTRSTGKWMEEMDPEEQYELIRQLLEPEFGPLYLTPPDIDQQVKQISLVIAQGIRQALFSCKNPLVPA